MTNGKIVSYIQKPYSMDVYLTKEENISSKYLLSASINKMFNIISLIKISLTIL